MEEEKLGQRRHRSLIVAELLRIAQAGVLKSHLMYKAHLNSTQLEAYLNLMLHNKLLQINETNTNHLYKTTPKGLKYIQEYETIVNILNNSESKHPI